MDSDARGNYQELLPLKLITVKRNLLPGTEGGSFFAGAGGKKIPELMKGLGKGVKSFKDGVNEAKEEINKAKDDIEEPASKNK